MYLHDSCADFRIVLRGNLVGPFVLEVERAWTTAKSTLDGKTLLIDTAGLTRADASGIGLLRRMQQSGAHVDRALYCDNGGAVVAGAGSAHDRRTRLSRLLRFLRR